MKIIIKYDTLKQLPLKSKKILISEKATIQLKRVIPKIKKFKSQFKNKSC